MQFRDAYQRNDLPALEELQVNWSRLATALGIEDREERHDLLRQAKEKNLYFP
jgi:hypothetical protein